MKKILLIISMLFLAFSTKAVINFETNYKYRILCTNWSGVNLMVGSLHNSETPVYYEKNTSIPDDAFWIVEQKDNKYAFRNAVTNQYITYDGLRDTYKRYIDLTDKMLGDSSLWTITKTDAGLVIANVAVKGERINLRSSDNVVGTYSCDPQKEASVNELFEFYDESGNQVVYEDDKVETPMSSMLTSLMIGGKQAILCNSDNNYLMPLKEEYAETNLTAKVDYIVDDINYHLCIDDKEVNVGDDFEFETKDENLKHKLSLIFNGDTISNAVLNFTFLPVVEIGADKFSSSYHVGSIRVNNPSSTDCDSLYNAELRYRGASAATYEKKSYAIKLIDEAGESIDRSFFGLREDNNWILDAMAIDHSRSRNRVSTDLWNDFSVKPYYAAKEPKLATGTRGRFVELMVNGNYAGIYCMTEKIDRKQLKLKKYQVGNVETSAPDTIRGLLYKTTQWSPSVWMGYDNQFEVYSKDSLVAYSNDSETWNNSWEMKYPDINDGEKIDWGPMSDAANMVATSDDVTFEKEVGTYFDLPMVRDFYLQVELAFACDNRAKNMYYYIYNVQKNKMISLAPWDMDGTWGRIWNGEKAHCEDAFTSFDAYSEFNLFRRLLDLDVNEWNKGLAERYCELRKTYFNPNDIAKRFAEYRELFRKSGADVREYERWSGINGIVLDFDDDLTYVTSWLNDRFSMLDNQYGYNPLTGVSDIYNADESSCVSCVPASIDVRTNKPKTIKIYSLSGLLVKSQNVGEGFTRIEGLKSGVYIVNKQKILVR